MGGTNVGLPSVPFAVLHRGDSDAETTAARSCYLNRFGSTRGERGGWLDLRGEVEFAARRGGSGKRK